MFLTATAMLATLFGGGYLLLRRYATPALHEHRAPALGYCPCDRCFSKYLDEQGP